MYCCYFLKVRWKSLCAALKLLGCFDPSRTQFEPRTNIDFVKRGFDVFEKFFCTLDEDFILNNQTSATIPQPIGSSPSLSQQQQQQSSTPTSSPSLASSFSHDSPNDLSSPISPNSSSSKNNPPIMYNQMDEKLIFVCYIMRFLYDTALDAFDKYSLLNISNNLN